MGLSRRRWGAPSKFRSVPLFCVRCDALSISLTVLGLVAGPMRQIEPYHRGIRYRTDNLAQVELAKKREEHSLRAIPPCLDPSHAAYL